MRTARQPEKVNIRTLMEIGFLTRDSETHLLRRVTDRFIRFVIDPTAALQENPYMNPLQVSLNALARV